MDNTTGGRKVPTNQTLFGLVVNQAKMKYRIYPSPGASAWVHRRYLELGGRFEDASDRAYKEKLVKHAQEMSKHKKLAHGEDGHKDARHKGDEKKKVASKKAVKKGKK